MQKAWARKQTGFTIVELLIVIVVIGILAAITIVAYNGVQERARLATAKAFEAQLRGKYLADGTGDWSFDDCSGGSAANKATGSADTITGTATWINDTATGSGCALRFNGATRIETTATLGAKYYVKAAWIRITSASCGNYNIISQGVTNGADAPFWAPSCKLAAGYQGSYNAAQSTQLLNDGKWHYVAAIWEDSTLTLYIDGATSVKTSVATAPLPTTGVVAIGSHGGGNYFNGDIDNPFVAAGN